MKEKLENSKNKDFIQFKKDYSKGNASPYREWQERKGNYNKDSEPTELAQANPDILDESQGLWFRKEATEEQQELIRKLLEKLTKRQQQIVKLLGYEGKSLDSVAVILKIKKQTIKNTVNQIRKKFHSTFLDFQPYK